MDIRFDGKSTILLWVESFVFAAIYGAMFHSWSVFGILSLGLAVLMSRPKTAVYSIFIICSLWAFVFAAFGYGFGGWIGAVALGATVFYKGVRLHLRDLKRSPDEWNFVGKNWRQQWYLGGQSYN